MQEEGGKKLREAGRNDATVVIEARHSMVGCQGLTRAPSRDGGGSDGQLLAYYLSSRR